MSTLYKVGFIADYQYFRFPQKWNEHNKYVNCKLFLPLVLVFVEKPVFKQYMFSCHAFSVLVGKFDFHMKFKQTCTLN